MNDWHKDLENKFNMIKKEEAHEDKSDNKNCGNNNRSSNSNCNSKNASDTSNNSSNRSSNIFRRGISEKAGQINKVKDKGGNKMISVEDALKDMEVIEKEATDVGSKAVVKALKVMIKFLSTMRSNQLLTEPEKIEIAKNRKARNEKSKK